MVIKYGGSGEKEPDIMFTHHLQIVETVESLGMEGNVFVHPLSPACTM